MIQVRPGGGSRFWAAAILVVVTVVVCHWPVLGSHAQAFDDGEFVMANSLVRNPSWSSAERFFTEISRPSTVRGYYLPIPMISLMLDWGMGGRPGNLEAFHRTSLVLHVANTLLVLWLLHRLSGSLLAATLVALMFGLHPLTVQSIAWIAERKALLGAAFGWGAIACYVKGVDLKRPAWIALSLLCYVLAVLSKPTVVTLPFLLLILDAWPLRRLNAAAIVEKWPFLLVSVLGGIITLVSFRNSVMIELPDHHPGQYVIQVCYLVVFYLLKMIRPGDLSLVYPPPVPYSLANPAVLAYVAATLGLALVVVASLRRTHAVAAGAAFFLVALAPTFGILKWSWVIAYDNYVYFPAFGVLLLLAWGLRQVEARAMAARAAVFVIAGVLLLEARATRADLEHWRDSVTLWRHVVATAPYVSTAHNGLGTALLEESRTDEAIVAFRRALELDPNLFEARVGLGAILMRRGEIDEAARHLNAASALQPNAPSVAYYHGVAAQRAGRWDEAAAHFKRAIELQPGYTDAIDRLGTLLVLMGREEEGIRMLRQSVTLEPSSAHAHFALAMVLLHVGGHDTEAREEFEKAVRLQPEWVEPLNQLAWLKATSPSAAFRDVPGALALADRAVALTREQDAVSLDTRAAALAAAGRFDDAIAVERSALGVGSVADSTRHAMQERLGLYERRTPYVEPAAR